jgi:hypothetical protein
MVHILSQRNRSEFLAVPELVRFDMPEGTRGPEPTLLVKTSSLTLKYLVRQRSFKFVLFFVGQSHLGYAIQVNDDPQAPATLWSIAESSNEVDALLALGQKSNCPVYLFNELAVNVAWGEAIINLRDSALFPLLRNATICSESGCYDSEVGEIFDAIHRGELGSPKAFVFEVDKGPKWYEIKSTYITNSISVSELSIFAEDEGAQQEVLALWLVDTLLPSGAVKSPQIHGAGGVRELSDLLLTHQFGCFLLESKVLSILERGVLPDRAKLKRNVLGKLKKAINQLTGGCKNLQRGYKVTDLRGKEIVIERQQPVHAIVLVPDLSLLGDSTEFGGESIKRFAGETSSFLHILDPSELLRMVQSAVKISSLGKTTTPMMAFDYYMVERLKRAVKLDTANFGMLLRIREK